MLGGSADACPAHILWPLFSACQGLALKDQLPEAGAPSSFNLTPRWGAPRLRAMGKKGGVLPDIRIHPVESSYNGGCQVILSIPLPQGLTHKDQENFFCAFKKCYLKGKP